MNEIVALETKIRAATGDVSASTPPSAPETGIFMPLELTDGQADAALRATAV